jgi:hypothetical protein
MKGAPAGRLRSPYLGLTDRYERAMHGWVDAPDERLFRMTVRVADPWVGVEVTADTTPSPAYRIERVAARVLVDAGGHLDPGLTGAVAGLVGVAMTAGFTRRASEVTGGLAGGAYFVDAAIEVARLARQVTRLPRALVHQRLAEGPLGVWRLDNTGWVDIPGSCYALRPEAEALFHARRVQTLATAALYDPPPGGRGIFNRTRIQRLEARLPGQWLLTHAMFDEVHAFQVWLAVAPATAQILDAGSITSRLPYGGICSDPQGRVQALVGQTVDAGLRRRLGTLVGGPEGCAQLFDLTADLLKLLVLA